MRMVKNKQYNPEWIIGGIFDLEFDASLFCWWEVFCQEGGAELLKTILFQFFNWSLYAAAPCSEQLVEKPVSISRNRSS